MYQKDLSFNRLKGLDVELLRWTPKLVAVNLASNALSVLPGGLLKELDQLEELDMSSNRLRTAPGLAGLHHLQAIDLASNCLTALPSDLLKDTMRLESFSASRNELSYIEPNTFRHLPRLAFLDLTSNRILEVSTQIIVFF
ncbi:unnamed protein product [Nezara viridula]|uniref:Uncharacterized protein n=1 Tax=Nezara viridula TaxID=85310 RepID=A0A9P0E6J6_NEZVI|nr:unnamed protein product [Nezara viridula]